MKIIGEIWKKLPRGLRLRIIRATQKKFTFSVAAVITDRAGRVLLLEHFLRPASGWGIPGGFVEHGEQPAEAIRRELREETALELENLSLVRVRTLHRHVEMLFRAEVAEPDRARVASREIKALGWFAVGEMPPEMSPVQKATVEKVLRGEI